MTLMTSHQYHACCSPTQCTIYVTYLLDERVIHGV